jgi:hypothetical protein
MLLVYHWGKKQDLVDSRKKPRSSAQWVNTGILWAYQPTPLWHHRRDRGLYQCVLSGFRGFKKLEQKKVKEKCPISPLWHLLFLILPHISTPSPDLQE